MATGKNPQQRADRLVQSLAQGQGSGQSIARNFINRLVRNGAGGAGKDRPLLKRGTKKVVDGIATAADLAAALGKKSPKADEQAAKEDTRHSGTTSGSRRERRSLTDDTPKDKDA